MSGPSSQEIRHRLAAIESGPWAAALSRVRPKLSPLEPLQATQLSASNRRRASHLASVLRPHFLDPKGITSPSEIETRDDFDLALTLPQLYELAVQTGYLPPKAVSRPAGSVFSDLLWSAAARTFLAAYDYVAVPMLATRLGFEGFPSVSPPEPDPQAAVQFAGFLAHLREFFADDRIATWTEFLDDYYYDDKFIQRNLRAYLEGARATPPSRTPELLEGAHVFVDSLASTFAVLDDHQLAPFGLVHAYWLQKFFGFKLDAGGYVKNLALWGPDGSWAKSLCGSPRLLPDSAAPEIAALARRQFTEKVALLERAFAAVRELAASSRQSK